MDLPCQCAAEARTAGLPAPQNVLPAGRSKLGSSGQRSLGPGCLELQVHHALLQHKARPRCMRARLKATGEKHFPASGGTPTVPTEVCPRHIVELQACERGTCQQPGLEGKRAWGNGSGLQPASNALCALRTIGAACSVRCSSAASRALM